MLHLDLISSFALVVESIVVIDVMALVVTSEEVEVVRVSGRQVVQSEKQKWLLDFVSE